MLLFDGGTQRSISNRMTHSCGTVLKDETHFTEAKGAHNVKKKQFLPLMSFVETLHCVL